MKKAAIYNLTWDSLGGGERYTAQLAKLLEETNYEVSIWWSEDIRSQIKSRFDIDLAKTKFYPNPLLNSSFVKRLAITSEFDVIFWVSDGSVPMSLAKKNLVHFQIPFTKASVFNKLKSKIVTSVCNSLFTKSVIDHTFGIDSQVIYPPVDGIDLGKTKKENLIVSVGRLSSQLHAKRQDVLIDAFKILHANLPNWKLIIAGGSKDIHYYKTLLDKVKGFPIKIIANPSLDEVKNLFRKSKLFWSATGFEADVSMEPEKVEHFGITPVEAMSAGSVPLVYAAGGHMETVQHGKTGYHWKTTQELVDLTDEIARNYRKWGIMSSKAQQRSTIYSVEKFNEAWKKYL